MHAHTARMRYLLALCLLATPAWAQRALDDMHAGDALVALPLWQYPVVAVCALLAYALAGWVIVRSGRWAPLTAGAVFVGLGIATGSWLGSFGLMLGVGFAALFWVMRGRHR